MRGEEQFDERARLLYPVGLGITQTDFFLRKSASHGNSAFPVIRWALEHEMQHVHGPSLEV